MNRNLDYMNDERVNSKSLLVSSYVTMPCDTALHCCELIPHSKSSLDTDGSNCRFLDKKVEKDGKDSLISNSLYCSTNCSEMSNCSEEKSEESSIDNIKSDDDTHAKKEICTDNLSSFSKESNTTVEQEDKSCLSLETKCHDSKNSLVNLCNDSQKESVCSLCGDVPSHNLAEHISENHICLSFIPVEQCLLYKNHLLERTVESSNTLQSALISSTYFICRICGYCFKSINFARIHKNIHKEIYVVKYSNISCLCNQKSFLHSPHKWMFFLLRSEFSCLFCKYYFSCEIGLLIHFRTVHTSNGSCLVCNSYLSEVTSVDHWRYCMSLTEDDDDCEFEDDAVTDYSKTISVCIDNDLNYIDGKDFRLNTIKKNNGDCANRNHLIFPLVNVPDYATIPQDSLIPVLSRICKKKKTLCSIPKNFFIDFLNLDFVIQSVWVEKYSNSKNSRKIVKGSVSKYATVLYMLGLIRVASRSIRKKKVHSNKDASFGLEKLSPISCSSVEPTLSRTRSENKVRYYCTLSDLPDLSVEDPFNEISGEWTKQLLYICCSCGAVYSHLADVMDHKWEFHPRVLCAHTIFHGAIVPKSFCYQYIPPWNSFNNNTGRAQLNPISSFHCTLCDSDLATKDEFYEHLVECGKLNQTTVVKKKAKRGFRYKRIKGRGHRYGGSESCTPIKLHSSQFSGSHESFDVPVKASVDRIKKRLVSAVNSIENKELKRHLSAIISQKAKYTTPELPPRKKIHMKLRKKLLSKNLFSKRLKELEKVKNIEKNGSGSDSDSLKTVHKNLLNSENQSTAESTNISKRTLSIKSKFKRTKSVKKTSTSTLNNQSIYATNSKTEITKLSNAVVVCNKAENDCAFELDNSSEKMAFLKTNKSKICKKDKNECLSRQAGTIKAVCKKSSNVNFKKKVTIKQKNVKKVNDNDDLDRSINSLNPNSIKNSLRSLNKSKSKRISVSRYSFRSIPIKSLKEEEIDYADEDNLNLNIGDIEGQSSVAKADDFKDPAMRRSKPKINLKEGNIEDSDWGNDLNNSSFESVSCGKLRILKKRKSATYKSYKELSDDECRDDDSVKEMHATPKSISNSHVDGGKVRSCRKKRKKNRSYPLEEKFEFLSENVATDAKMSEIDNRQNFKRIPNNFVGEPASINRKNMKKSTQDFTDNVKNKEFECTKNVKAVLQKKKIFSLKKLKRKTKSGVRLVKRKLGETVTNSAKQLSKDYSSKINIPTKYLISSGNASSDSVHDKETSKCSVDEVVSSYKSNNPVKRTYRALSDGSVEDAVNRNKKLKTKRSISVDSKNILIENSNELVCLDCKLMFDSEESLEDHKQDCTTIALEMSIMEEDCSHECPYCHLTFAFKSTQRKHSASCRSGKQKKIVQKNENVLSNSFNKKKFQRKSINKTNSVNNNLKDITVLNVKKEMALDGNASIINGTSSSQLDEQGLLNIGISVSSNHSDLNNIKAEDCKQNCIFISEKIKFGSNRCPASGSMSLAKNIKKKKKKACKKECMEYDNISDEFVHMEDKRVKDNKDELEVNVDDSHTAVNGQACMECGVVCFDEIGQAHHALSHELSSICSEQKLASELCSMLRNITFEDLNYLLKNSVCENGHLVISSSQLNMYRRHISPPNDCILFSRNDHINNLSVIRKLISQSPCHWLKKHLNFLQATLVKDNKVLLNGTKQDAHRTLTALEDIFKEAIDVLAYTKKEETLISMKEMFESTYD